MRYLLFLLACVAAACYYAYRKLRYWRLEQYADFPQLPPSLVWGHLKAMGEEVARQPKLAHSDYAFSALLERAGSPPVMLVDLRPVMYPILVIRDYSVAEQFTRASKQWPYSQPKSPTMKFLDPLIGAHSIINADGERWKELRRQFNPGFAPQHLLTLLPQVLDPTRKLLAVLDAYAQSGEEFLLGKLTTGLTFDIIGSIVMDVDLRAQTDEKHELVTSFSTLIDTYKDVGLNWIQLNPRQWWHRRQASQIMGRAIRVLVQDNFATAKAAQRQGKKSAKGRSVLALSLADTQELDEQAIEVVSHQLQSFLFAGHDTTASLLAWTFYELSRYPKVTAKLRAELDEVLGKDASPEAVTDALRSGGEDMISRLTYTSAVIKEALRLYPPAGSARMARVGTGFQVELPDGRMLPVGGMVAYAPHTIVQRDPATYGANANEFVPERWLESGDVSTASEEYSEAVAKEGEKKAYPPGTWRPFERGPRNCIGQELANLEARVIIACVARRYDFEKVGVGAPVRDEKGRFEFMEGTDRYKVESELYNTHHVTSKPFDGMQMRVHLHES